MFSNEKNAGVKNVSQYLLANQKHETIFYTCEKGLSTEVKAGKHTRNSFTVNISGHSGFDQE